MSVEKLSNKFKKAAENLGGAEDTWWIEYVKPDDLPHFNKSGHKDRSLANSPQHIRFWKKAEKAEKKYV